MKLVKRTYRIGTNHDVAIKKASKKLKLSESEIIRRRIPSWEDMVKMLQEEMKDDGLTNFERKYGTKK